MSYWFYYNADGQKQGAITEEQLKELAANGKITPVTTLEHAKSGDKTIAADVKWLTFGEAKQPQTPPPHVEHKPFISDVPPAQSFNETEKNQKGFGEKMQDVGNALTGIGKNMMAASCGCGCLVMIIFVTFVAITSVNSPSFENLPTHSILSDDEFGVGNKNREVVVRLQEPAVEAELEAIANKIKHDKRYKSHERTNVHFYLPGMRVGEGAWATANFNPELRVHILGNLQNEED